ncbi:hypothetical protein TrVFT333_007032 [Trichoderma virens FT-333]|nr:hypothetical protein TrVFT333_007032 [Trichoderma virens FT-333]
MLPDSQSSDSAPQGRTYRSTPSAKQVRFPVRRSRVRGQGKGKDAQKRENASLKQQTLTQMDFVSSFSEELVTLSDDDASDEPAILQRETSEAEARLGERLQEGTRGNSPVIQDTFASPDDSLSASVQVSPPRFQPLQVRDAMPSLSPSRVKRMGPLDEVKASPRRRAHWSRNLDGSKRLKPSQEDDMSSPTRIRPLTKDVDDREIPDSDEEYEELELQEDDPGLIHHDTFVTGHETQLVLEELASLEYPERDGEGHDAETNQLLASTQHSPTLTSSGGSSNSKPIPPIEDIDRLPTAKASLQSPTISPSPNSTFESHHQTQLSQRRHDPVFESQRVPLHILQSFTPVSARSDILLPTPSKVLSPLVNGSETVLHLSYRVPEQVRRFWLLGQETLRYMACVQPGKPNGLGWDYHVDQVYELNNPVEERDMQEEGWVTGQVRRYIYLPPAIVGQLLWNLRCATFDRARLEHDDEISQDKKSNIEAVDCREPESSMPSQTAAHSESCAIHHDTGQPSSLLFQDHGSSLATLPTNVVIDSSPLLTKSQMLPDSLLSDDIL